MSVIATPATLTVDTTLARSRAYCRQLTKAQAKNFYYGLKLLPEPKRSAMFALYAYMRLVGRHRRRRGGQWSRRPHRPPTHRRAGMLAASRPTASSTAAPPTATTPAATCGPPSPRWFASTGCPGTSSTTSSPASGRTWSPSRSTTFAQLHAYCYRVAGIVGLASIYIWGFEGGAETQALAVDRGVAFQLTNILRDLREDAARGRTYLPAEDLARFGVTEADLRRPDATAGVHGPDAVPDRPRRGVLHQVVAARGLHPGRQPPDAGGDDADLPPAAQADHRRARPGAAGAGEPELGQQAHDRLAGRRSR